MSRRINVTLTFDRSVYETYQKVVGRGKISRDLESYLVKRLAELSGSGEQAATPSEGEKPSYGELLREYDRVVVDSEKRKKWLQKDKTFNDLGKLATELSLSPNSMDGLEDAIPRIREKWKGDVTSLTFFIAYLQDIKAKRDLEWKIDEAGTTEK